MKFNRSHMNWTGLVVLCALLFPLNAMMMKSRNRLLIALVLPFVVFAPLKAEVVDVNGMSPERLSKLLKLTEARVSVYGDKTLRFSIRDEVRHKGRFYTVPQAKPILAELRRVKVLAVTLPKEKLLDPEEERAFFKLFESYGFKEILFLRASGHGTPILVRHYVGKDIPEDRSQPKK